MITKKERDFIKKYINILTEEYNEAMSSAFGPDLYENNLYATIRETISLFSSYIQDISKGLIFKSGYAATDASLLISKLQLFLIQNDNEDDFANGNYDDERESILDLIDSFKSLLISIATGGDLSSTEYKSLRNSILDIKQLKPLIPDFIKANRSANDFFRYMQARDAHYQGRRNIINDGMNKMAEYIEFSSDNDLIIGVDHYKKGELLGSGGFGEVYKYNNEFINKDFAIKIYNPVFVDANDRMEGEKRFYREARILFDLSHENIVRIYDVGKIGEKPFIRMEYIEGENLEKVIKEKGPLSFNVTAKAVLQILAGLQCAHDCNIIHRDLKPTNIMVAMKPEKWTCKIIDFGISAFMDTNGYTRLTRTGEHVAGSLYTDPQLMINPSLRDKRSDIYSVGAIMYLMLCGLPPGGTDAKEYLIKSNGDLNDKQLKVVMKALSSSLDERYKDCKDMIIDLKAVM